MSGSMYTRLTDHTDSDESYNDGAHLHHSMYSPPLDTVIHERARDGSHAPSSQFTEPTPFQQPGMLSRSLGHPTRISTRTVKKGKRTKWRIIYENGDCRSIEADKRSLIQMMGLEIPMRDMRLLDNSIPTSETIAQILIRENALVFSMEHVRIIITAEKVVVPEDAEKPERAQQLFRIVALLEQAVKDRTTEQAHLAEHGKSYNDSAELPFELHMLEVALGEVCRQVAADTQALDQLAHPALDALTKNPDTPNLARVRGVKGQHQRLLGRVKIIRESLERYLEDDGDMLRMCLTKRKELDPEGGTGADPVMMHRVASISRRPHGAHSIPMSPLPLSAFSTSGTLPTMGSGGFPPALLQGGTPSVVLDSGVPLSQSGTADCHDLLEVENLLESYFSLIDSTYNKLLGLAEYIEDTEDYINIELDYNRNRLIRFEILLTTATFALAFFAVVAGILGENVPLPLQPTLVSFWGVNTVTLTFCCIVFLVIYNVLRAKKLI